MFNFVAYYHTSLTWRLPLCSFARGTAMPNYCSSNFILVHNYMYICHIHNGADEEDMYIMGLMKRTHLALPNSFSSSLSNNLLMVCCIEWNSNARLIQPGCANKLRLTRAGSIGGVHKHKELKWDTAQRYGTCISGKVFNLKPHTIVPN